MDKWAAIFDWDGVIIDSSRQHAESWERLAKAEKRTLPAGHFQKSFGHLYAVRQTYRPTSLNRSVISWHPL